LVNRQGETIILEPERSEALRQWIKDNNPSLLGQAHYYWFRNSLKQVSGTEAHLDMSKLCAEE